MTKLSSYLFGILFVLPVIFAGSVKYRPVCKDYSDPPKKGWHKWSDAHAWRGGKVPGVEGREGVVVNIPCDTGIILDTSVTLDRLVINGWLKVEGKGPYVVNTNFVIVQGKLTIGTPEKPYDGKITFNLTLGNYSYGWTRPDGEDSAGVKGFVVLGGSVELNGVTNDGDTWTTLSKTAQVKDKTIAVSGDVTSWPVGAKIVIASTDFDANQAETRTITYITKDEKATVLGLDKPLEYNHWGDRISVGGERMDESAEVALLDRNIIIQGAEEEESTFGGHFTIFQTQEPQFIQGVELINMGQRGQYGRYPLYFYMCQNAKKSVVAKLSIHDSNQRCIVVHGTWELTLDSNVAYNTMGHCYFFEDGIEHGNIIKNNIGITTKKGVSRLPGATNSTQSDEFAATFWISNPNNTVINNRAAGSEDSGFWLHFGNLVYGASRQFPEARNMYPKNLALGRFEGNVAHSNGRSGLRVWPEGYRPRRYKPTNKRISLSRPATAVFKDFTAYKNSMEGIFISKSDNLKFIGGSFADNRVAAIAIRDSENVFVRGALVLGETPNLGNPTGCNEAGSVYPSCEPLDGCSLPVDPKKARSVGIGNVAESLPMVGILFTQGTLSYDSYSPRFAQGYYPTPNALRGVKFGLFTNRNCRETAAIAAGGEEGQLFLPSHSSSKLKFLDDDSPPFYMAPRQAGLSRAGSTVDSGPVAQTYAFHDRDGTLTKISKGGFVVANTDALITKDCVGIVDGGYGYICPGCYRQLSIDSADKSTPTITIAKADDSAAAIQTSGSPVFVNLMAEYLYTVAFDDAPEYLSISYADPGGCEKNSQLRFLAPAGKHWEVALITDKKACAAKAGDKDCKISTKVKCGAKNTTEADFFDVDFGGKSYGRLTLYLGSGEYKEC